MNVAVIFRNINARENKRILKTILNVIHRYPDLFDWFKHFIGFDEASMELLEKKEAMALEDNRQPWSEIDFTTCKRYGPSYRALPANVCLIIPIQNVCAYLFVVWHPKV